MPSLFKSEPTIMLLSIKVTHFLETRQFSFKGDSIFSIIRVTPHIKSDIKHAPYIIS